MNGALHAVLTGPSDHLAGGRSVFHAAETDFAEKVYAGFRERFEIVFDHAVFQHRRAGENFDAAGTQCGEATLCGDGQSFEANDVFGAARRMHFAGGNHGGDAAMQAAIDPAELILARSPVAGNGMDVTIDEAGTECGAVGVDDGGGGGSVEMIVLADGGDAAVDGDDGVCLEARVGEIAGEEKADVADEEFGGVGGFRSV